MATEWSLQEEIIFRGEPYLVSFNADDDEKFSVEVQSSVSADQWRASFEKDYIEELTHKTGNFKQFDIFANMLENAITESSDAVSLELLTYSDLENLRSQKNGTITSTRQPVSAHAKKGELTSKRYLILIYSVEFDRIHYPLPLPYMGKPDPVELQNEVRALKQQLSINLSQMSSVKIDDNQKMLTRRLKDEITRLQNEKEEIIHEFELFKKEVKDSTKTSLVAKEMKVLKGVIKNLEAELLREKSKHQKAINKLNQEYNQLLDEIEESKSNERSLRSRVKNLMAELNMVKGRSNGYNSNLTSQRVSSPKMSPRLPKNSPGVSSQNSSQAKYLNGTSALHKSTRSNKVETDFRGRQRKRTNSFEDLRVGARGNNRSLSRELPVNGASMSHRSRSRSPSGSTSSRTRFDPTSYIKEKAMKHQENKLRRSAEQLPQNRRRRISANASVSSQRGRSSSYDRSSRVIATLKTSQRGAGFTSGEESDASSLASRRSRNSTSGRILTKKNGLNSSKGSIRSNNGSLRKDSVPKPRASDHISPRDLTAAVNRSLQATERSQTSNLDVLNQSTDLEDIDARLNALQEFMKLNL